jgi:pimeloyl-ACP methyl ester carboxylesterase
MASKDQWFSPEAALADSLLNAGFAVIAFDAPYHGDRAGESGYRIPTSLIDLRNMSIQWAIEHRRVLDALGRDSTLDVNHAVVVGYSLGTVVAFALGAIDTRVKAVVAAVTPIGGVPNATAVTIDPRTFAPGLHIPVLMLMGTKDEYYTAAEATAFYEQIAEKRKELVFFESGHMLPAAWVSRAVAWLARNSR